MKQLTLDGLRREALYELVWSQATTTVAEKFGISDVALAKICREHGIPLPPRGHWAKIQAGKRVHKQPLPPRGLGMPDTIRSGNNHYWSYYSEPDNLIGLEIPPPPEFPAPVAELIVRIRKMVGRVGVPESFDKAHRHIARILEKDDVRRKAYESARYKSIYDAPLFGSPYERRRLRILSALYIALERCGMRPEGMRSKDSSDFGVRIGRQHVSFTLDHPSKKRDWYRSEADLHRPASDALSVRIPRPPAIEGLVFEWEDKPKSPIEKYAGEMVIALIVTGEIQYREGELSYNRWLHKRKSQLIEEAKRRKEEEERQLRERLARAEKARVDRLLGEAAAFRQATDIRSYVESVKHANDLAEEPVDSHEIDRWAHWACAQADRIDPVLTRSYLDDIDGIEDIPVPKEED